MLKNKLFLQGTCAAQHTFSVVLHELASYTIYIDEQWNFEIHKKKIIPEVVLYLKQNSTGQFLKTI